MASHQEQSHAGLTAWLPHTEAAARDVLTLPLFAGLSPAAQEYLIERLAIHVGSNSRASRRTSTVAAASA
jgi:dTDP-4-amino-4,6-dideoxygalactose transaminase